jgi:hypothetical protein
MLRTPLILDRIDAFGRRLSLPAASLAMLIYFGALALWVADFALAEPATLLVFAPAWAPAFLTGPLRHVPMPGTDRFEFGSQAGGRPGSMQPVVAPRR